VLIGWEKNKTSEVRLLREKLDYNEKKNEKAIEIERVRKRERVKKREGENERVTRRGRK
jgi:hypothetical protein